MTTALGSENTGQAPDTGAPATSGNPPDKGTGTGDSKSWRDTLPEDIKENPALKSFTDIPNLAKSYIHAQSQLGKKGAIVPTWDKATPEEVDSFYKAIGLPEKEKYDVPVPKDYKIPDPVLAQFKEIAHKNGVLPKQAAGVLEWYAKFESESVANAQKVKADEAKVQLEGLKKEWGEAYDKELSAAKFAAKEVGGEELIKYLNDTGLGNDTKLIKTFAKMAKFLGEDKLREGGVGTGGESPTEIKAALDELRANGDNNGLYDKNHPMHAVSLAKMESLAKRLTGGR